MRELVATVTSKGQITIPIKIRRHLGIKAKDKVVFVVDDNGDVWLQLPKYPDIASLRGVAGKLDKSLSWDEMREIAYQERQSEGHHSD